MLILVLLGLLPCLVSSAVLDKKAGETSSDIFPPTGTTVNTAIFPNESEVGYPGITLTGVEPAAIQTAPASLYAYNTDPLSSYPLVSDHPNGSNGEDGFDITKYWGNLSPWYSVSSNFYGLNETSPNSPKGCSIIQVHLLYRHGARYPTTGSPPSTFASKISNATKQEKGFNSTGELNFLNEWKYLLGAELLTISGRLQNFALGASFRQQYGYLLNNFTESKTLPVFRTESQDRMVKTANNFAAGMFGVPEYLDQVNIEIMVETPGINNTGAPYETCLNSNVASKGSIGSTAAAAFAKNAFNETLERLQSQITGVNLTSTDIIAMLQLCSYETDALGYSAFCKLFTEEDFENYEYYFDISFYYNNGAGSPVAAAQGKGFLSEFVSRFTGGPTPKADSSVNSTLDNNPIYFPLNQSIYADATHEVIILDTLTAFNLSAIFSSGPLPINKRTENSFKASQVVPFATHLTIQVLECSNTSPSKQIRFILNDAVLPIDQSYDGCEYNKDGLCSFDNVVNVLQKRIEEIDWNHDCLGNYTASPGNDYNGRAPRN
ncbi:uncharacterized protein I206_103036 [Kwoniella pini CBS 10737]|uniref:Acid phosphatase n=1 Tax=Kwoniella pini CBS 10737 TaxID=1296096 RepID=A0A1B9IAR5_9TREE|nr:acid phosphatase [Kwoniella pini CBS 10737]OCF52666.1 acid phosphatase [Kwoniella pini CBS 10737]